MRVAVIKGIFRLQRRKVVPKDVSLRGLPGEIRQFATREGSPTGCRVGAVGWVEGGRNGMGIVPMHREVSLVEFCEAEWDGMSPDSQSSLRCRTP